MNYPADNNRPPITRLSTVFGGSAGILFLCLLCLGATTNRPVRPKAPSALPPDAPKLPAVVIGPVRTNAIARIAWDAVEGASGYTVYGSNTSLGTYPITTVAKAGTNQINFWKGQTAIWVTAWRDGAEGTPSTRTLYWPFPSTNVVYITGPSNQIEVSADQLTWTLTNCPLTLTNPTAVQQWFRGPGVKADRVLYW